MFNLFINKAINENLYNEFIDFVKKVRNQGGNWAKEIIVDDNQYYYLTKAEINLVDDVDDYNIDCANEDENDSDYVKLEIEDKMKTYTNVEAVKKVIEAIEDFTYDKDFQRILSSIDRMYTDNITEKDLKALVEQYSDEVEMKKDMKQREEEDNENNYKNYLYNKLMAMAIITSRRNIESNNCYGMEFYFAREHMFPTLDAVLGMSTKNEAINWLFNPENEKYLQVVKDAEVEEVNWLELILFEKKISQYEFANKCGLERSTINRIINKNTPIDQMYLSTAEAIAKGLGMSLIDFIEKYYV